MDNELVDLNLEELDQIEGNAERKLQIKDRYAKLSEKGIASEKARVEAEAKLKEAADARAQAEKERDFFKDFSKSSSKYSAAGEYQDAIFEKVKGGYTTEDAIVAVLAKEGKLPNMQTEAQPIQAEVAGGSAPTNLGDGSNKELKDMTTEDKLHALQQMEKEGAISLT